MQIEFLSNKENFLKLYAWVYDSQMEKFYIVKKIG